MTNLFNPFRFLLLAVFFVLAPMLGLTINQAQASPSSAGCPALLNQTFAQLQDDEPRSLCEFQGKVVLVVNTASFCGFTQQYEGLEALYRNYKDQGLVVLGFPSNDFGNQEPGSNQQIAEFCSNTFSVRFPMFAKTKVRGPGANPLFAELARLAEAPGWNFHKYLIGRDGRLVSSYSSAVSPNSRRLRSDLQAALSSKPL
jgi:glutathione peroxidase